MQIAEDRDAVIAVDLLQVAHDGMRRGRVKTGHRLIGQHQAGRLHERPSDRNPLLLSARERIGSLMCLVGDTHAVKIRERVTQVLMTEIAEHAAPGGGCAEPPGKDVSQYGRSLDQVELLKDHPNAEPQASQIG